MSDRAWSLIFEEALLLIDSRYDGAIYWATAAFLFAELGCALKTAEAYAKMVPIGGE